MLELYGKLKELDSKSDPKAILGSDLTNLLVLVNYMAKYAIVTPHSFDLKKCNDGACCGVICISANVQDGVTQRQPAPRLDPLQNGNFFRREDALANTRVGDATLIGFTDLPSMATDNVKVKTKKSLADQDKKVAKELNLRSWNPKKVRTCVSIATSLDASTLQMMTIM